MKFQLPSHPEGGIPLNHNSCACREAFFEAVSGDFGKANKKGPRGRSGLACGSFGRLANIDECYPSFLAFGLIDTPDAKGKSGVNTHTSILNRFLQSGGASKVTRSAGTYGGAHAPKVSFGLAGNCHPAMALSMVDGSTGCQVAAAHDRFLFYTAPRVVPHEDVNEAVKVKGSWEGVICRSGTPSCVGLSVCCECYHLCSILHWQGLATSGLTSQKS